MFRYIVTTKLIIGRGQPGEIKRDIPSTLPLGGYGEVVTFEVDNGANPLQ
jgi:hypothetical protein